MATDLNVALKFSAEGIPKTVGEVNKITQTVEKIRKENEETATTARLLAEAYNLSAKEVRQLEQALKRAAREAQRAEAKQLADDVKRAEKEALEFEKALNKAFDQAVKDADRLEKELARAAEQAKKAEVRQLAKDLKEAEERAERLRLATLGIATALAVGIGGAFAAGLAQFQQFEQFEAILENALGSPQAAQDALAVIEDFAQRTPFQLNEVVESFIKLQNRGIEPTTDQLTQLGDIAASQGKTLDQIVEALLDAQTGEFERLKEFGIQASSQGDQVAIAFRDATLEVAKTPDAIAEAILSLGDLEGIAGSMAAQSATLSGRFSNLQDEATKTGRAFGEFASGGARLAVDSAIQLLQTFNNLPAPIQQALVATTAFVGVLAAAVAAVTAYNLANGQRVVSDALAAANTIKTTAATIANTAATNAATAARAIFATVTGQATAAQLAQTQALAAGTVTLAAFAGAVASVALVVDTFRSVSAEANQVRDSVREIEEALSGLNPSSLVEVDQALDAIESNLNPIQKGLDVVRDALGLGTAAEAAKNQTIIAFGEIIEKSSEVGLAAAELAINLEQGVSVDPEKIDATVSAIDRTIAALEAQKPVTEEAIAQRDGQIASLERYRARITDTIAGIAALTGATGDLAERIRETNAALDNNLNTIDGIGTAAEAALAEQRAAGELSAEEYQDQLTTIENNGLRSRINANRAAAADLKAILEETEDPEAREELKAEILEIENAINKDRISIANNTAQAIEEAEKEAADAVKEAEKEKQKAREESARQQADLLRDQRVEQRRLAEENFQENQRLATQEFDDSAANRETAFNESERQKQEAFEEQQRQSEELFSANQRSDQDAFNRNQEAKAKAFQSQQQAEARVFQERLDDEQAQGNREFDALENEVDVRLALAQAETDEERDRIKERQSALEKEAELRRQIEADVLRQRGSILSDADLELSPLEQARQDFEDGLQAKQQAFEEQQQNNREAFEQRQQVSAQAFEEQQRVDEQAFEEQQRQITKAFEAEKRAAQSEFNQQERDLERAFDDNQRSTESDFKNQQRQLDLENAQQIASILESARPTEIEGRFKGGPVEGGKPYMVGERGPEMIFPNRSGYVATARQTSQILKNQRIISGNAATPATGNRNVERKLDQLIKTVKERPRPIAPATINLGSEATVFDAMEASMAHQRALLRRAGL